LIGLWEYFQILQNTKREIPVGLKILMDSSFFGCIFFGFEALIPLRIQQL